MKDKYCIVIVEYTSPYIDPLKIQKGEKLQIGIKDSEWPGWVWCMNNDGIERWVPSNYLEIQGNSGMMLLDYEATELAVSVGEELKIEKEESGWVWAVNKEGKKGWVPLENVKVK
ncbi:MAG: SH3 domain-containing protein [Candidatus Lokiarchaeota archaeon]|nr:SH3 domain-containing protein [Candidatus Lokiarchaeota archaeon]